MIRYYVEVPPALRARATYGLRLLLEGQGIVSSPASAIEDADLVYAPASGANASAKAAPALLLAADPTHRTPGVGADSVVDVVAAAFEIASGAWEDGTIKNDFGVPSVLRNGGAVRRLVADPLVARLSEQLLRLVQSNEERRNRSVEVVPRWPNDHGFAICLTHDVDRPFSRPPAAHYTALIRRSLSETNVRRAARGVAGYIRNVLIAGDSGRRPDRDPQFGFNSWMKAEEDMGIRSAFFVAVRGSAEPGSHPRDVYYDAGHPAIVAAIRNALERGFEVGLHASIRSREHPEYVEEERDRLSRLLGGLRVGGVRHHYLALDSDFPERTLSQHERAGFDYDSSLGFNESAGFRRGLAWPFRPFDRERDVELGILQVPLTAMDMAIFRPDVPREAAIADLGAHLDLVEEAGGCAVINWHLAQAKPGRLAAAGPALLDALGRRRGGGSAGPWWATPSEVSAWWHARRERVLLS